LKISSFAEMEAKFNDFSCYVMFIRNCGCFHPLSGWH